MRKYHLAGSLGLVVCAGLAACSTSHDGQAELRQQTVQYQCSNQAQEELDLKVQYTFQGEEPVTARVIYDNQAITLMHDASDKANMTGESFSGEGYTWTTGKFTYDDVDDVDGNMLTQLAGQGTNGTGTTPDISLARAR